MPACAHFPAARCCQPPALLLRRMSPSLPASPSALQDQPLAGLILPSEKGVGDGTSSARGERGVAPHLRRPASAPQAGHACGRERWSPCGLCQMGWSPSSLGRRGMGSGPLKASSGPWLGAGQAPLLESVFICIYFEQLPTLALLWGRPAT